MDSQHSSFPRSSQMSGSKHGCDAGGDSTCRFYRLSYVKEMPFDAAERQRRTVRPALPHGPTALPGGGHSSNSSSSRVAHTEVRDRREAHGVGLTADWPVGVRASVAINATVPQQRRVCVL